MIPIIGLMVAAIGMMLAFYVVTRMAEAIIPPTDQARWAVTTLALATVAVAILTVLLLGYLGFTLVMSGIPDLPPPDL